MFSIKEQEVRAGGFTVRFGSHTDDGNTCFLQVSGKTEGHQITFRRDGEALVIAPIMLHEGEPVQHNHLAPAALNKQAQQDAALRKAHNDTVEKGVSDALVKPVDDDAKLA